MSKVQAIESELQKLSVAEMCQVRDWLDSALDRAMAIDFSPLREDVLAGAREVQNGKVKPFDDAAIERIKARGRKLLSEK